MQSLVERTTKVMAQGETGTNSKRPARFPSTFPTHVEKQEGPYIWDEAGNKFLDFGAGLGTSILGYGHPKVAEAAKKQIGTGYVSGTFANRLEIEVAEMLTQMIPAAESVRFLKTGSEACTAAVRIARASAPGKRIYSSGYHGWHDMFTSLTQPARGVRDNFEVYPLEDSLDWAAAAIVEPVELDNSHERKLWLNSIHEKVKTKEGFIIFDEIVSMFRTEHYCVSNDFDIKADLITGSKCLGNGFPIAFVGGSKEVMSQADYFVSSTFSGEAVSLAAAKATLEVLRQESLKDLNYYGNRLRNYLNNLDPEMNFTGYGTRAAFNMDNPKSALFAQECARAGVLFPWAWYFNFAHMEQDVEQYVINICEDVMSQIRSGKVKYVGELPTAAFKR